MTQIIWFVSEKKGNLIVAPLAITLVGYQLKTSTNPAKKATYSVHNNEEKCTELQENHIDQQKVE